VFDPDIHVNGHLYRDQIRRIYVLMDVEGGEKRVACGME
jgi:hypothetical protein